MVKVGVIGGTFDPPHKGHLAIALEAHARLELSRVIFVPAGQPWLKSDIPVSPAEDRLEMVRLAISPYPYFEVSRVEIDRPGPSYTADTLEGLRAEMESDTEIYFIMGWDCVSQLPQWRQASKIVKLSCLVAIPRPGYPHPDLKVLEKDIPGITQRVEFLEMPLIDVSATEIRSRVAHGDSVSDLVPEAVEGYIKGRGLYRTMGS